MNDAGKVVDAVKALRQLMTALDSATYALQEFDEADLQQRLSQDADDVFRMLERLERSGPYRAARKELLDATEI